MEDQICRSRLLAQALVYGDNRPYCVTLVVPDMVELRSWAEQNGMSEMSDKEVMESNELKKVLSEQIAEACSGMKSFEKPLKWIYTLDPFTQENQLLTPKMSLRRNNVLKIYMPQFDSVYSGTCVLFRTHDTSIFCDVSLFSLCRRSRGSNERLWDHSRFTT